ncbi:hypothetical protein CC117_07695 [Parafrankia colletiae]|uniref:Uncharacterized protein n=1 Tax=Parafrankia colletiae TaxID=573497 RepID=A0A1S1Q5N3_9ACTN|nr:hypothetical protein [Parafrankia colletiae]MCK9902293.1 hypothetical protein [Frankia sp. Cpl3]OHV29250.1 hypothetical protein CC117_07695 [Parafrankia colletiae]
MRLTPLTVSCNTNGCPAVFLSDSGSIVVQGDHVDRPPAAARLSPGEALVVIPRELLLEAVRHLDAL